MTALLRTEGLTKHFRGLVANDRIDFTLQPGEVRSIIGPNGAGKTTFLSMISGHAPPTSGRIWYRDRDITDLSVVSRARIGIGRKFQTPTLFEALSAYENVELAVLRTDCPPGEREARVDSVLGTVRLTENRLTPAQFLSHGQRQWLEIALLLASNAELLLLDEPTAGMTVEETAATAELINRLARERKLSIIIIEHDINFIRDLAARVTVLHLGRVLTEGSFDEVAADQRVREVYLGS
ncbi:MAG: ATP-binding cassette domain-containing protein [Pseudomonadota bacterium]